MDALTSKDDEGRRSLRKASVRWQPTFDPGMSEWGNPLHTRKRYAELCSEYIGAWSQPAEVKHLSKRRKRNEQSVFSIQFSVFSAN